MSPSPATQNSPTFTARSSSTVMPSASSARHIRSPELRQSWLPITATVPSGARSRASWAATASGASLRASFWLESR